MDYEEINKGKATIDCLSDDALIMIFSHLSFLEKVKLATVCKRWKSVCDSYNLFATQNSLGSVPLPVVEEDHFSCRNPKHLLTSNDCIYDSLFRVKPANRIFNAFQRSPEENGKILVVKKEVLQKSLSKCGQHLKVLGLNFCYCVDEEVLLTIARTCNAIEHLDLSFSSAAKYVDGVRAYRRTSRLQSSTSLSSRSWKSLSDAIGNTLIHLNLNGFTGITDNGLKKIFQGCQKLQEIHLSIANFGPLQGYSLAEAPRSVTKVSLFVEENDFANSGSVGGSALLALAKSAAKDNITSLRVRRSLRIQTLNVITQNFPKLKNFDVGDWFLDVRLNDNYTQVGTLVSTLKDLEVLTLRLPEVIKFDDGLSTILKNCRKLKKLLVYGGPVGDTTLELLPLYVSNLELLTLSYMKNEANARSAYRFTDAAFKSFAQLRKLKHLQLNGALITDQGVKDFFEAFGGDINEIETFDVRNCVKLTKDSLKVCVEKSKLREGKRLHPLTVFIHGTGVKLNKQVAFPETINVSVAKLEKTINLRNDYFTPHMNLYDIDEMFGIFINEALEDFMIFYNGDESDSSDDDDSILGLFDDFDYFRYLEELDED